MLALRYLEKTVVGIDNDVKILERDFGLSNLKFKSFNAFETPICTLLREQPTDLIGIHLCGTLSIRFRDLMTLTESGILVPCCLKGKLGQRVKVKAKEERVEGYGVLVESLRGGGRVVWDEGWGVKGAGIFWGGGGGI